MCNQCLKNCLWSASHSFVPAASLEARVTHSRSTWVWAPASPGLSDHVGLGLHGTGPKHGVF